MKLFHRSLVNRWWGEFLQFPTLAAAHSIPICRRWCDRQTCGRPPNTQTWCTCSMRALPLMFSCSARLARGKFTQPEVKFSGYSLQQAAIHHAQCSLTGWQGLGKCMHCTVQYILGATTPFFIRPWVEIFRLSFRELREIKMWIQSERKIITIATPETKHTKNHP